MNNNFENTWELCVASWKAETVAEKRELFKQALADNCIYNDPTVKTEGWDALAQHMLGFQQQILGGHFVTTSFMSHSNKSIATWALKTGDNMTLGNGISYGEYNEQGLLTSMTGFFEAPA